MVYSYVLSSSEGCVVNISVTSKRDGSNTFMCTHTALCVTLQTAVQPSATRWWEAVLASLPPGNVLTTLKSRLQTSPTLTTAVVQRCSSVLPGHTRPAPLAPPRP